MRNNHQQAKPPKHKKHIPFISIDIIQRFTMTLTKQDLEALVTKAINEGIGDWGIIIAATRTKGITTPSESETTYTIPFKVIDIETSKEYNITKPKMLRAIRDAWIDFPYALDTRAGYDLSIDRLTREDIDEIIQLAAFREIQYRFN